MQAKTDSDTNRRFKILCPCSLADYPVYKLVKRNELILLCFSLMDNTFNDHFSVFNNIFHDHFSVSDYTFQDHFLPTGYTFHEYLCREDTTRKKSCRYDFIPL